MLGVNSTLTTLEGRFSNRPYNDSARLSGNLYPLVPCPGQEPLQVKHSEPASLRSRVERSSRGRCNQFGCLQIYSKQ
jgi:hypothetical protein